MMIRRSIPVAAALATLVAPLPAFAQVVTTGPLQPAPTLAMPLIFVLAVVLAGLAVYRLRRYVAGPMVGLLLFAAVTVLAGVGYATSMFRSIMISGPACMRETMSPFMDHGPPTVLMSECRNMISILAIQSSCTMFTQMPQPPCSVGQTLANGQACTLPNCPD